MKMALVVSTNGDLRDIIGTTIKKFGDVEALLIDNPQTASEALDSKRFDVVVLDIGRLNTEYENLLLKLQSHGAGLPVVIMTDLPQSSYSKAVKGSHFLIVPRYKFKEMSNLLKRIL